MSNDFLPPLKRTRHQVRRHYGHSKHVCYAWSLQTDQKTNGLTFRVNLYPQPKLSSTYIVWKFDVLAMPYLNDTATRNLGLLEKGRLLSKDETCSMNREGVICGWLPSNLFAIITSIPQDDNTHCFDFIDETSSILGVASLPHSYTSPMWGAHLSMHDFLTKKGNTQFPALVWYMDQVRRCTVKAQNLYEKIIANR